MSEKTAQELRDAASVAHERRDIDTAVSFYKAILRQFPNSPEAVDAIFYLSSIGEGPRRAAKRAETVPAETKEVPRGGLKGDA
jgi:hypothetical protein